MRFTIEQLPTYQEIALGLLDLATDGDKGRHESDPIYKRITENRDFGAGYSSCGDLCHWLLFRLGVRLPFINRNEAGVWKSGLNVSRLAWTNPARSSAHGEVYEPGDILAIWNKPAGTDAHVLVVRSHVGNIVQSSDYGQPGGAQRSREVTGRMLGDRVIMRVMKLRDVLRVASDLGALAEYQTAEQWRTGGNIT